MRKILLLMSCVSVLCLCGCSGSDPEKDSEKVSDYSVTEKESEKQDNKQEEKENSVSEDNTLNQEQKTSSNYNIADGIGVFSSEGIPRLETSHFEIYMPSSVEWDYTVVNENCINIFYPPAKAEGFGGNVVSIMAYDWGDNGYGEFPQYSIAGLTADKKYVAVFPTDVQYSEKTEAGYRKLFDYMKRLDNSEEKNMDNPFIPLDE